MTRSFLGAWLGAALCAAAMVGCTVGGGDSPGTIAPASSNEGGKGMPNPADPSGNPQRGPMVIQPGTGPMPGPGPEGPSTGDLDASIPTMPGPPESGDSGMDGVGAGDAGPDEPSLPDCLAQLSAPPLADDATPYPGGRWSVPEATYGAVIENNVQIEMSDGVVLVGDVSYPTDLATGQRAAGEFPVILTQNPYGSALFGPQYGEIFVTHGYIFATVDVRGTSRSGGGVHDLFSPREADDGAELVTWATTLQGADGRVGLQGCSQLGINQLETATRLGPDSPVKAMIPACPSGDFYRDTVFDNGVPSITANFLVPDAVNGDDTAFYREYWQVRDRVARAPEIARTDIPLLLWSGWHEPGALGSLDLYTVLQNVAAGRPAHAPVTQPDRVSGKYQVIIGDWGHGGGLDLGIELQWYDTWIKGIDTGLPTDTETPLHLMELGGTQRWINARCYPLVERYTPRFLTAGSQLATSPGTTTAERELRWVAQDRPESAIEYTSEAFADGAMLAGPLSAQLWVTSSNTNVQLFVELLDRAPDGTRTPIRSGSIIGALRKTDPEKSWQDEAGLPVRPYLALDEEQPLTPGEATELTVPLGPTVFSIEPGHSLVLRIATHPPNDRCLGVIVPPVGCYPTTPMLNSLRGGVYQLHVGGEQGSLVSLPLLEYGALSTVEQVEASPTGNPQWPLPVAW